MALDTNQYGYLIDPLVPITDAKGTTIKDGFIRVYIAGSSTPVITYRNFDGAVNEKTIELDNSGRCKYPIIVNKSLAYKVVVYDAQHSQEMPIITVDKMFAIGASFTVGAGATVVTGLNGFRTKPDGFVDASVIGTDGYVALDHTLVEDDLDTDAKVTAVEEDRYIPLLNEDVNDPDSKMTLKRLKQWVHSDNFVVAGTIYPTLQDAIDDADNLSVGEIFETNGFHTSGDGGAARYLVSSSGTANGMDIVQLAAGKLAIIKPVEDGLYPEQIGFKTGDNTYDLSVYIARIISMNIRKIKLHFKSSYYYVKSTINISVPDVQIIGGLDVYSGYSTRLEYIGTDGKVFDISHRRFTAKHLYIQNSSGDASAKCFNSTTGSNHYKYKLQNIHISQFGYGCYFTGSTHWMHEFSDVTFGACEYGMYFEQFLLCSRFEELLFSGCTEYDILFKTEPTAVAFENCNFGVNKHAVKFEYFDDPSHTRFGQVSFNSCSFEYDVDTSSIVNDSGFIAVDDEVNINLEFTGCNFSIQRLWYNDYTTARAISFGKKTRASFRGCQGAKLIEYAIRRQLFNENKPPMIELGSLKFIDNQQGFEIPAYTDQSATVCVVTDSSEVECVESYGNNVINKDDCWKIAGSLYHDDVTDENVYTSSTGNVRTLVVPVPKYLMGKTVTLSIDTSSHNRFYLCASNLIPGSSARFKGPRYNVSPTTVGGRDYVTISVSTDWNYLLLYYSNNVADENAIINSIMMNADGIYTPYAVYASPSYRTRLIPTLIDLDSLVTALNARGNSLS